MTRESQDHNSLSGVEEEQNQTAPGFNEVWAELEVLRREINASWESEKTAVELISEQRR